MTIRNDASRPEARLGNHRRARSVIARQGQVLLDVDLTAAGDISADRAEVETLDTLGPLAVPIGPDGFRIGAGGTISAGRLYLDGLLVENPSACTLVTQPHPAAPLPPGPAIAGMKALVRHIDPVEDRRLADKALGDAAAAGRGLVDWQVFAVPLTGGGPVDCGTPSTDWDNIVLPSSGRLSARVDPGTASANFCSPASAGGFTRLENVLYRIEVDGGVQAGGFPVLDGPRFGLSGLRLKLSRRNASVMTRITNHNGRELTVDPPVLDAGQWFAAGGAAEIVCVHDDVDPRAAASQTRLFTVALAQEDRVTLAAGDPLPLPAPIALGTDWYLRLWDVFPNFAISAAAVPGGGATNVEIDCGDGVLITVWLAAAGTTLFRRGDWWSFTARADGTIDWPLDAANNPVPLVPDGPRIHYARLAVSPGPEIMPIDCRPIFVPLTQQFTLLYRGGDGQLASLLDDPAAFVPLRGKARVAVECGGLPIVNRQVRWSTPAGAPGGQINGAAGPVTTLTDANGLTEVTWALDRTQPEAVHALAAELVTSPAAPVTPVRFGASFATAHRTSYVPGCDLLSTTTNVQDALTALCVALPGRFDVLRLTRIALFSAPLPPPPAGGPVPPVPPPVELLARGLILNGQDVAPSQIQGGIRFEVDRGDLAAQVQSYDPIVDLELDMPYALVPQDADFWGQPGFPFGTTRLRLDGAVVMKGNIILFELTPSAIRFLSSGRFLRPIGGQQARYRARLRLRSQWIWINTPSGRVYLNAEYLGVPGPITRRELAIEEIDPQRAADLEMFFYLLGPPVAG